MVLHLYDTRRRGVLAFLPLSPGRVGMYTCGPTVYADVHIGNMRAYVVADLLRRVLVDDGLVVDHVVNITDVGHLTLDDLDAGEDRMELASRRERRDAWQIAAAYTEVFFDACRRLGILAAQHYPRATAHVPQMVAMIERLIDLGHAYVSPQGNVYFSVRSFPRYGELSGNRVADLLRGARVEEAPDKQHAADFALWKRDPDHQMQWDSPWGRGFPGWHIECSAMARTYLGDRLDIHTGGEDNAFPHHECEIAQSEAVTGQPFVGWWVHVRHLLVDGAKMSKSTGTLHTLDDVVAQGFAPRDLRYLLLGTHYRSNVNFTWEALEGARESLRTLDSTLARIEVDPDSADRPGLQEALADALGAFRAGLHDDLHTAAALAAVHRVRRVLTTDPVVSLADHDAARGVVGVIDDVLGLGLGASLREASWEDDPEIDGLVRQREHARRGRDFAAADRIRDRLGELGVVVEDTPEGPRWHRSRRS